MAGDNACCEDRINFLQCKYGRAMECSCGGIDAFDCPEAKCGTSSKKGLLGLLGLLGLIPLLLCCSLCCLLLICCLRRKKVEGDVHLATFDPMSAPVNTLCMAAQPTVLGTMAPALGTPIGAECFGAGFGAPMVGTAIF